MEGKQHLQCLTLNVWKYCMVAWKDIYFLSFLLHSLSVYRRVILLLLSNADKTIKCGPLAVMGHYLSLKCVSSLVISSLHALPVYGVSDNFIRRSHAFTLNIPYVHVRMFFWSCCTAVSSKSSSVHFIISKHTGDLCEVGGLMKNTC